MSKTERIYLIDQILSAHQVTSVQQLLDRLEVSPATLKRDIAYMRDRLNAPIVYNRDLGGYQLNKTTPQIGNQYELPGLWFSAEEIHALLTMQHLLTNLDTGGLLGAHIKPLLSRLMAILGTGNKEAEEVHKRIKIENVGARKFHLDQFQVLGSALLRRKRVVIEYTARGTGETTSREVSPQRLVYYRGNWHLDSWCHLRNGIRNFSVDAILRAEILEKSAEEVTEQDLNAVLGNSYGIFNGTDIQWAKLKFTASRARWVSVEVWHAEQKSSYLENGDFLLEVPFSDDREIMMDILKYGADVEVISPLSLRQKVMDEIKENITQYQST